ncbi:MAG TPA: GEVED domain-containing protein [Patescibacteria group bacterium]|nr:GEVED domain-containing protein [Patescibacteria group bacterium]
MHKNKIMLIVCLLCLSSAISISYAQQFTPVEQPTRVIRLYNENLPADVDLNAYLETGEVVLLGGQEILPPKITPGPAPAPYPYVHVWDKGVEQLGVSMDECDGIWFTNANLWHPNKWALVRWLIRVPNCNKRDASEFAQDLTVSLWVDWNQDRMWSRNEQVLNEHINIFEHFPQIGPDMEITYLTKFRIPDAAIWETMGQGAEKYETKLWVRGVLSYDDPDASPDGESLFGEVEDYRINFFEIQHDIKKIDE